MDKNSLNYTCSKCQNKTYNIGELRATGGGCLKYSMFRIKNIAVLLVNVVVIQNFTKQKQAH